MEAVIAAISGLVSAAVDTLFRGKRRRLWGADAEADPESSFDGVGHSRPIR
jgi:hypothetical protein